MGGGHLLVAIPTLPHKHEPHDLGGGEGAAWAGVVGGFAIVRLLAKVQASPTCTPFPLSCGPPLGYLDWAAPGTAGVR